MNWYYHHHYQKAKRAHALIANMNMGLCPTLCGKLIYIHPSTPPVDDNAEKCKTCLKLVKKQSADIRDLLLLFDDTDIPVSVIEEWSSTERSQVKFWVERAIVHANDNFVWVPKKPDILGRLT